GTHAHLTARDVLELEVAGCPAVVVSRLETLLQNGAPVESRLVWLHGRSVLAVHIWAHRTSFTLFVSPGLDVPLGLQVSGPYSIGGCVLSALALLGALGAVYALTREHLDERFARRTVVYLALAPFGFVFSMVYPESVVLAAIVLSALAGLRGRWGIATLFAAI